jgi:hypothetical protein
VAVPVAVAVVVGMREPAADVAHPGDAHTDRPGREVDGPHRERRAHVVTGDNDPERALAEAMAGEEHRSALPVVVPAVGRSVADALVAAAGVAVVAFVEIRGIR